MRRLPHPITGMIYTDLGEGRVRVEDQNTGEYGIFRWDGLWLEGDMTQADLHYLVHVGGQNLPEGRDIYWAMLPTTQSPDEGQGGPDYASRFSTDKKAPPPPPVIGKFIGDPGQETEMGARSSSHVDLEYILKNDRHPERVPDVYWLESPMSGGPTRIPTARFHDRKYHDLEVERLWKRTWQMACREDDIPEVGDYHIYEIASLSFIIVRTGKNEFKAHYNACLHRGRILKEMDGKGAKELRCPFHGWTWDLDGGLKHLTCEWDLPGVAGDVGQLPGAKVGTWGGFIFINPDMDAEPLEEFLGPVMMAHYEKFKLENRYKHAHVRKTVKANWKVAQEAFMEAYHIAATHPQLLLIGGDSADVRYDVFGNWGRAQHVSPPASSPHRGILKTREEVLARWRASADANAKYLRSLIGDEVDLYSDAELNDSCFNDLFPNMHPWGGWARIVFRFRPLGDDPDYCQMEVMLLAPWPEGKEKPAPAKVHELRSDQKWCDAPEIGTLARILDQDSMNMANVHKGMKTKQPPYVWYTAYQEGKIRNFHENYRKKLELGEDE
ncbi:aromatic ring-hydroxylating oxygenase subunit alpha [Novosphingobium pentaromativorans]|nr:aromatic ring-hydroxylating dioxygenase subunit alpha [Novosphingobium pentaromativorans]